MHQAPVKAAFREILALRIAAEGGPREDGALARTATNAPAPGAPAPGGSRQAFSQPQVFLMRSLRLRPRRSDAHGPPSQGDCAPGSAAAAHEPFARRRRRGPAVRARAGGARPWAGVRRRASGLCGRRWRSGARRGSAWRWTWQKRRPARDSRDPDSRVRRAPTAAQLRPPVSPRARALPPGAWASRGAPQPGALRARPSPGAGLKGRGCPRRGSKPPLLTEQLGAGVPSGMGCGGSGSRMRRARAGRGGSGSRVRRACCAAVQEV